MLHRFGVVLGGVAVALMVGAGGAAGAAPGSTPTAGPATTTATPGPTLTAGPTGTPTPGPTLTCPPALPVGGVMSAATETSVTIRYSMLMTPPCGYNAPVTITLFASADDARQWVNPVAEAVSGPERSGTVTIGGLTPDTAYWFRFSADGKHDPYVIGTARTAARPACAATVAVDSAWNGGYVATVTVRNVGAEPLDGWHVSWRWGGDERLVSVWNGVAEASGPDVVVGNASYNGRLAIGGAATFGMLVAAGAAPGGIAAACGR
ncbi:cellulose binding domain-containing protein [Actinoplanes sp. CA-030573]|uniref:cellulose binding domain-containing protein n=1 Tax=Actinoplanes sp. CA-030573 TaxID=3239898 RepID=UPI003D8CFB9A